MNKIEIQWDFNWDENQKAVYHVQMRVKKIKLRKQNLLRLLFPFNQPGKTLKGDITQCSIDLPRKEIDLLLPLSHKETIHPGDLLDLSISDRGWCIEIQKHASP